MRKFVTSQSKGNRWHKSLFVGLLALAFSFSAHAQQVYEQGVTVLSTPTVAIIETEVCANDSVTILFSGRAPFTLDYTPNTLGLPFVFGGPSGYPLVHDSTDINGTNHYTARVKAGQAGFFTFTLSFFMDSTSCDGLTNPAQTHSILVRPLPHIAPLVHSTYCNGERYWGYDLGDYPNDYEWTNIGDFVGLQANGTGDIPTFTIVDTALTTILAQYAIKATRDYGQIACYAYDTLLISAKPTPSVVAVQDVAICHNQPMRVDFTGRADHYRWSRISGDIIPGINNNGLDSIVAVVTNSSGSVLSAVYEVLPEFDYTISTPSCVGNSITFTITVYPDIYMTSSHDTILIMSGETFNYTATSNLSTVTYAWSNGSNIATISEMLTNGNADIEYNTYSVIMTAGNCTATDSIVVGVIPATQISVTNQYVCADESTNNSYTAPASFNAVITTSAAISDTTYILTGVTTNTIQGSLEHVVFNYGLTNVQAIITLNISGIQTQVTDNFTVTVNALPTLTLNDETYCAGATVPAHIFGTGTATCSWTSSPTNIGANETGTGILPEFVATNSGAVALTDTFYVTATIANPYVICAVTDTFTIGVNPVPIVNQINDTTICSNTSLNIAFSGNITTGVTYNWHRISGDAINGLPYSGTNNLTGTVINNGNTAQMAVYEVTPTATGCTGTATTFSITVIPTIAMTSSHDTIYIMTGGTFSYTATSNLSNVSYQWDNNTAGATVSETLSTSTDENIECHTYHVTMSIGNCTAIDSIVVAVVPPVTIVVTDQYVYADEGTNTYIGDATFEVVVNTDIISVLDTTYILTGATTDTVVGTLVGTVFNSGETNVEVIITVGVSNGPRTQVSANFIVVVIPASMKLNDETYCVGAIVPAHILGTDITTYRWTHQGDFIGLTMPGSTGVIPSFTATTAGVDTIYVIAPNDSILDTFIITVNALPTTNTVTDTVLCSNENVAIHFNGSIANTVYHYILMNGDVIQGLPISGNDSITGTVINTTIIPLTAAYQVIPEANGCMGNPLYFHITVNPALQIDATVDVAFCSGATAPAIHFSGNVSGATYTWTNISSVGIPGLANSGTGNMPAFLATNTTALPITATYTVEMTYTNENTDCTVTDTFDITVYPLPTVDAVNDTVLCSNGNVNINFSGSVGNTVYHYILMNGDVIQGLPVSGDNNLTGTAINTTIMPLTAAYQVIPEANGCMGNPLYFHITVNPALQINAVEDVALCNGTTAPAIHFGGNVSGATYTWTRTAGNVIPGLAASGTGNMPTFFATNSGSTPLTATYTVVMTYINEGVPCTATDVFDITVYPTLSVSEPSNDISICNGDALSIIFDGNANTFSWRKLSGNIIPGLDPNGTGNINIPTLTNTGNTPLTSLYEVIPAYTFATGICQGIPYTFTITINPTPTLTSHAAGDTICSGGLFTYTATSNVPDATFTWSRGAIADINNGVAGNGNTATITEVLTNSSTVAVTVLYQYIIDINGCTSDPTSSQVSVVVLPLGEATFAATYNVCANEPEVILDYTSSFTALTYRILFDIEAQDAGFISITMPTVLPVDGIHVALPAGVVAGNYHATIIVDNQGCQTEYSITIHVYPLPEIVSQPQSLAMLCSGQSQLEFYVEATGEDLSYQWYFEGTAIAGATDAIYSVVYDSTMAGSYYVIVMAHCDTLISDEVTATTNTIVVIEKWTDVLYVDNSGRKFTGYQWYKDGNPVVIDGKSQYYAEEPYLQGTYRVRIYLTDGVWIESCDQTIDNSRMLFDNLYPNPAQAGTEITVELYSELSVLSNSTYELYDVLGRRLMAQPFTGNSFTIQAPATAGSYHLRIINNEVGVINKRFIVK